MKYSKHLSDMQQMCTQSFIFDCSYCWKFRDANLAFLCRVLENILIECSAFSKRMEDFKCVGRIL